MSTSTILPVIQPVEADLHPESLAKLHTAIVDASHGDKSFGDRAEPDVAPMLAEFRAMHDRHERELATAMARHAHPPDEHGSFTSYIHGGIAWLREKFGGVDRDVAPQILDGERRVIGAYNDALRRGQPRDVIELLQKQREELGALVARHDPDDGTAGAHPG